MAKNFSSPFLLFFSMIIFGIFSSTLSQPTCQTHKFSNGKTFVACNDLSVLNSSLHWNYSPLSGTIDIAFKQTGETNSRWVSWAINPTSKGMIGSQSLVAFQRNDGTVKAYTSQVLSYGTKLEEGNLTFPVYNISSTLQSNTITIFATIKLPNNGSTLINHLWQEGPIRGGKIRIHSMSGPSMTSLGSLDLISGKVETSSGGTNTKEGNDIKKKAVFKNIHGVICALSWGILMPIGATVARYLKVLQVLNPAWFYIHLSVQSLGYVLGVVGWGTGLWLGAKSVGITYKVHKCAGISLFCLATVQCFIGIIRPAKEHKYRIYFNWFHYIVGYSTIGVSIFNVYTGLDMLKPGKQWRDAYSGILIGLGCIAVILEGLTWYLVLKQKTETRSDDNNLPQEIIKKLESDDVVEVV